jgi:hypothetical protein
MPKINLRNEEERKKLGTRIRDWIQAGLDERKAAENGWWRDVWAHYENRMPESPGKNLVPLHVPLSQPRQDALTANVCTVIGKQDPIMLCDIEDTELASRRQKLMHKLLDYASIDSQLRKASTDATNVNRAFLKVTPKDAGGTEGMQRPLTLNDRPGIDVSVIPPKDMAVFPAVLSGCQTAVFVGNRFYKRAGTIQKMIDRGDYFKVVTQAGDDPSEYDLIGTGQHAHTTLQVLGVESEQQAVELWDGVVRLDLGDGEDRYRVTLAFKSAELLAIEKYDLRYTWYFDTFYIADGEHYWSGRSVARNLFTLQDTYNKLWSMFYTWGASAAKPPMIGPKLDSGETYTKWEAGDYIETTEPVQPWAPTIRTELQPITVAIQAIERNADQVARVSQNSLGSDNSSADTATENSIIAAGVSVGIEEYISNFSAFMPAMAEHVEDIVLGNYQEIAPYYTHMVEGPVVMPDGTPQLDMMGQPVIAPQPAPLVSEDELKMPTCWRVNGTSPSSTPQAKVMAGQQLAQMAADPRFGFNPYAIGTVIYKNSPLAGDGNIQYSEQEMMQQQMQMQQAQMQQQMAEQEHESRMGMEKKEADIERENARTGNGAISEALRALVERSGPEAVLQLLANAQGQGGNEVPE